MDVDKTSSRKRKRSSLATEDDGGKGVANGNGDSEGNGDRDSQPEPAVFGEVSAKEATETKKERHKRMRLEGSALAGESIDFDSAGGGRDGSKAQGEEGDVTGAKEDEGPFTAFNLDENREDGYFDDQNNFVWRKDPNAAADQWLEDVEVADMSKIKANAKVRDDDQARRMTTVDALRTLAAMLRRQGGETVLQAVQRLGKEMKEARAVVTAVGQGRVASNGGVQGGGAKGWRAKRARQKAEAAEIKEGVGADKAASAAAIAAKEVADENVRRLKAQVDALTEAANFLLQEGETAIYEQTLATVLRVLRSIEDRSGSRGGGGGSGSGGSASEAGVKEAEKMAADRAAARADAAAELAAERAADALKAVEGPASSSQTMWEYKPLKQPADGSEPEVQGPFTSAQMRAWIGAGYFKGKTTVLVRRVGAEKNKEEQLADDLADLDDLDDDDEKGDGEGIGGDQARWKKDVPVDYEKGWKRSDQVAY